MPQQKNTSSNLPSSNQDGVKPHSFSFVTHGSTPGTKTTESKKQVRAQAARASAGTRLDTIIRRRDVQWIHFAHPSDAARTDNVEPTGAIAATQLRETSRAAPESPDSDESPNETVASQPGSTGDWQSHLSTVIKQSFANTVRALQQQNVACDLASLVRCFENRALYNDDLFMQCLGLLVLTAGQQEGKSHLSRPLVVWRRHRLLVNVQAAVRDDDGSFLPLRAVVCLLAGWEMSYGEQKASQFHLRALSQLVPGRIASRAAVQLPQQPSVVPPLNALLPMLPAGFKPYFSHSLLPRTLLAIVGSLDQLDASEPQDLLNIQRMTLAATACVPVENESSRIPNASDIGHQVSVHVRCAAGITGGLLQLEVDDEDEVDALEEELTAYYAETGSLGTDRLLGTVYDELILWTTCMFCASTSQPLPLHIGIVRQLLLRFGLNWRSLNSTLAKYIWSEFFAQRLQEALAGSL